MDMRLGCIGLFVTDMSKMVRFYRDVMGMNGDWDGGAFAELNAGGVRLIFYGRVDFERMTKRTFLYPKGLNGTMELAFELPGRSDVDREFARLTQAGAVAVMAPADMPWGQRTSYVADPEGNLIELGSFEKPEASE